jgi:hypothetical protein
VRIRRGVLAGETRLASGHAPVDSSTAASTACGLTVGSNRCCRVKSVHGCGWGRLLQEEPLPHVLTAAAAAAAEAQDGAQSC